MCNAATNENALVAGISYTFWIHDKYPSVFEADKTLSEYFNSVGYNWTTIKTGKSNAFNWLLGQEKFTTNSTVNWFYVGMAAGQVFDTALKNTSDEFLFRTIQIFRVRMQECEISTDEVDTICDSFVKLRRINSKSVWERHSINTAIQNRLMQLAAGKTSQKGIQIIMGDVFKNISGSTIVSRSSVENAFNKIKQERGEEFAQALLEVTKTVLASGNKEAAENLNAFNSELQKEKPSKPVLKSLWQGLVDVLPSIVKLGETTVKIVSLFM